MDKFERKIYIEEMMNHGMLKAKGPEHYEDAGGHIVHESWIKHGYVDAFLSLLSPAARELLINRVKGIK